MAEDSLPGSGMVGMVLELTETEVRLVEGVKINTTKALNTAPWLFI